MADLRDILTLEEGKAVLGISDTDTTDDGKLPIYITSASRLMDQHVGPTVALSVTNERHDGWRHQIVLDQRPVISIASVVEWNSSMVASTTLSSETIGSAPAAAFLPERYSPDPTLLSGIVRRRASGSDSVFEYGRQNVIFTYTAGRVASTSQVDARFKHACGIVLTNLWRDQQIGTVTFDEYTVPKASFPAFALPNAVRQLLSEEIGQAETWGAA